MRTFLGLIALIVLSITSAHATPTDSKTSLFAGAEFGYLNLSPKSPEVSKDGVEGAIKLIFSHSRDRFVIDLGGGYVYSHLSAKGIQVITRGFEAELSPRYRFGIFGNHSWQVGPVIQFLTGGDVSYDESAFVEQNSLLRAGGKLQYEFGDEWIWRAGLSGITDLNISSRRLLGALFEVQVGLTPRAKPVTESPVSSGKVYITPDFAQVKDRSIRIYLGEALLSFPTGSNKLSGKAKEALRSLAPVLTKNEASWKKIRIEGHSDIRNLKNQNQALSEARALSVKKELVSLKLPTQRITSTGLGSSQPIDSDQTEEAYLLNRRVEIWIDDVEPSKIPLIMAELKQLN